MNLKDIIILETENFIAVNKPRGLVVNKSDTSKGETLQDIVAKYLQTQISKVTAKTKLTVIQEEFTSRSGILHRLDKDTTGVVLIAKNPEYFEKIKDFFLTRKIKKTYFAVVFYDIKKLFDGGDYLYVNLPIARSPRSRQKFAIVKSGRKAVSRIYLPKKEEFPSVLKSKASDLDRSAVSYLTEYKGKEFSFVKIKPKTGRTHQIRVHLKALNHEILGDVIYCGRNQIKFAKDNDFSLMLHASTLSFNLDEKNYEISAPFDEKFVTSFEKMWL